MKRNASADDRFIACRHRSNAKVPGVGSPQEHAGRDPRFSQISHQRRLLGLMDPVLPPYQILQVFIPAGMPGLISCPTCGQAADDQALPVAKESHAPSPALHCITRGPGFQSQPRNPRRLSQPGFASLGSRQLRQFEPFCRGSAHGQRI